MNRETSINLDLVRWIASFMVFIAHFCYLGTTLIALSQVEPSAHLGVLLFFVMSGYVIRFVADGHHPNARDYLEARWARINSVFLPVLVVTVVLDLVGARLSPDLYARYPSIDAAHLLAFIPAFLTFLYQNSLHEMRWFSNGPLWSVAYEVWYYIIFCAWFYFRGRRRVLLTGAAVLLAGWQILLLFPLWLVGAWLFKARGAIDAAAPLWARRLLCLVSLATFVFLCTPPGHDLLNPMRAFGDAWTGHGYHSAFLADYVTCVPVSIFLSTLCSTGVFAVPQVFRGFVRWNVSYSFTLYAFHVPVLIFVRATGIYDPASPVGAIFACIAVTVLCWAISLVTEQRKKTWRAIARHGGDAIERLLPGPASPSATSARLG